MRGGKVHHQVVRTGADSWDVHRVAPLWEGAHEYGVVGRVVLEADLYWVEDPKWAAAGCEWVRRPRGYLLPRAAFKAITDPPAKVRQ